MAKKDDTSGASPSPNPPPKHAGARAVRRKPGDHMSDEERREARAAFLLHFREKAVLRYACAAANVDRTTIEYWREHDKTFAKQYAEALKDAEDRIRGEIDRRALEGWEEPLVSGGQLVYEYVPAMEADGVTPVEDKYGRPKYVRGRQVTVRKYSDALLARLAVARLAEFKQPKTGVGVNVETGADGSAKVRAVFLMPEVEELEDA
jgi:hypothetical protein